MKVLIYVVPELAWNTTSAELPVKHDAVLNLAWLVISGQGQVNGQPETQGTLFQYLDA